MEYDNIQRICIEVPIAPHRILGASEVDVFKHELVEEFAQKLAKYVVANFMTLPISYASYHDSITGEVIYKFAILVIKPPKEETR